MEGISQVTCPNCSFQFSVEDALAQQIEDRVRGELQQKLAEKERQLSQRETAVLHMREQIDYLVEQRLAAEKESLTDQLKQNLQQDYEIQIQSLNDENEGQKTRIQQLLAVGIENERLKREFDEREQELRLEYESKVTEQLRVEAEKIARRESEKNALKFKEKDILIEQLNVRLSEAQMKIQQGSIQLQGEAQELALEELLGDLFPFDLVKEIKKGQKGADVLQEIRDGRELTCGKIYYESKRTKTFGGDWIQKLKEDNQRDLSRCLRPCNPGNARWNRKSRLDGWRLGLFFSRCEMAINGPEASSN